MSSLIGSKLWCWRRGLFNGMEHECEVVAETAQTVTLALPDKTPFRTHRKQTFWKTDCGKPCAGLQQHARWEWWPWRLGRRPKPA